MTAFKDRPDLDRKGLAAGVALIEADAVALALERAGLIDNAAMGQDRPSRQIRAST